MKKGSPAMTASTFDTDALRRYGYRPELTRSLGGVDLLIYGLIYMVVIAPFGIFGSVFQASASRLQ